MHELGDDRQHVRSDRPRRAGGEEVERSSAIRSRSCRLSSDLDTHVPRTLATLGDLARDATIGTNLALAMVSHLLDPRRFIALCRADWLDGLVALTTFLVTLLVGPERGILPGVAAAVLCLPWRTWRRPEHRAG